MRIVEFINEVIFDQSNPLAEWRPAAGMHVVLVTGQLARKGLQRIMDAINPEDFTFEIRELNIAVAAWIDIDVVQNEIGDLTGVDLIITPGKMVGDEEILAKNIGIPVVRGPGCYSELPVFLDEKDFENITDDDIIKPRIAVIGTNPSQRRQYGRLLSKTYEVPYLTKKNMLQKALEDKEPVGTIANGFLSRGEKIPHNVQASVVNNRLLDDDTNGFILVDYPETSRDATWAEDLNMDIDIIVYLQGNASMNHTLEELLEYYSDDPRLMNVASSTTYKEIVTELLTRIESSLQQCVIPDSGKATGLK